MKCPKCKSKVQTIDSRHSNKKGFQFQYRRKLCLDCEHRFSTYELPKDVFVNLSRLIKSVQSTFKLLKIK